MCLSSPSPSRRFLRLLPTLVAHVLRRGVYLLVRHKRLCVGLVAVVWCISLPLATRVQMDLSFTPLFAKNPELHAVGVDIRETFGALGTSGVGVVVDGPLDDALLQQLHQVHDGLRDDDTVATVTSPWSVLSASEQDASAAGWARLQQKAPKWTARVASPTHVLLWFDLDAPVFDLQARRKVVHRLQASVAQRLPGHTLQWVGYSVVEEGVQKLLGRGAVTAAALTVLVVLLLTAFVFRRWQAVLGVLLGTAFALPPTLAVMALCGWPVTVVSSALPTLLLMVGVADAIHILREAQRRLADLGVEATVRQRRQALVDGFVHLAWPCLLTTVTTVLGFASLQTASLNVVRDFGAACAIGVLWVHVGNAVLLPALLLTFVPRPSSSSTTTPFGVAHCWAAFIVEHARLLAWGGLGCLLVLGGFAIDVQGEQFFNREVHAEHPLRRAQHLVETDFVGFLGPDLLVRRRGGGAIDDEEALVALRQLTHELRAVDDVDDVLSPTDVLDAVVDDQHPDHFPPLLWPMAAEAGWAKQKQTALPLLVDETRTSAVVFVRTHDIGTHRAMQLLRRVQSVVASSSTTQVLDVRVGGNWSQAQSGMALLIDDMLQSFLVALVLMLPFLAFAARRWRLFVVALLPNIVPLLGVLAAMVALGIELRIGTAVVGAVALGIAVDDTLHLVHGLRSSKTTSSTGVLREVFSAGGSAILVTSVVLVAGFLALSLAPLHVLRDMGLLGACAMTLALVADGVWLPALWTLWGQEGGSNNTSALK